MGRWEGSWQGCRTRLLPPIVAKRDAEHLQSPPSDLPGHPRLPWPPGREVSLLQPGTEGTGLCEAEEMPPPLPRSSAEQFPSPSLPPIPGSWEQSYPLLQAPRAEGRGIRARMGQCRSSGSAQGAPCGEQWDREPAPGLPGTGWEERAGNRS